MKQKELKEVFIVGGGICGLAAAYEITSRDIGVSIIEESSALGGQHRQQTQKIGNLPLTCSELRGYELVETMIQQLKGSHVHYFLGHSFLGLYEDKDFGISNDTEVLKLKPKRALISTGAAETPITFKGWTLPGIMTIGAVQIMINREFVKPGKTALIIGSTSFAFELTAQLADVGIEVAGLIEKGDKIKCTNAALVKKVKDLNIPVYTNCEAVEALGSGKVEKVITQSTVSQASNTFEVDFVGLDGGRHPILEPFSVLNCDIGFEKKLGGNLPYYSTTFQTSAEHIYVAGNAAGVTSSAAVVITGMIAGLNIVESLKTLHPEDKIRKRKLWEQLYEVENSKDLNRWDSRRKHIEKHIQSALPAHPREWSMNL